MSLLFPAALALAALAVPIALMYMLKLRRTGREVASTLLWVRAVEDIQANTPWQRLRRNLLLLFELAVLAALVLMVARPSYTRAETFSGDVIVIVDQSYGMQLHDVPPSRFGAALAAAHDLAHSLAPGNVMSVIGMGKVPTLAVADSDSHSRVDQAIDSLKVGTSSPNFLGALSLANSLARSGESTHAVVLTSRDSGITALPLQVSFPVQIVRIGGRVADVGITSFSATRAGAHTAAALQVRNFGAGTAESDLDLYVDGQLADVRPVRLAAGSERSLFWTDLPSGLQRLEAHLTRRDDLALDKTAYAAVAGNVRRKILLVTPGDFFLQTALKLDPSVTLQAVRPEAYVPGTATAYDAVIFEGFLPSALPAVPTLLVSPPEGRVGPLSFGAERHATNLSAVPPSPELASLLRYVDLSDVHVSRIRALHLPSWMHPVAAAGSAPAIAAGESGGRRAIAVSFDLEKSDWPLRLGFPIAVQNMLHYLTPGLSLGITDTAVGQPVPLSPDAGARSVEVTRPDGTVDRVLPPFAPYTRTGLAGFYVARETESSRSSSTVFAVNLFHPRTSQVPGPAVLTFGHTEAGYIKSLRVPVGLGWALGLAALGLLSAEWWFSLRR